MSQHTVIQLPPRPAIPVADGGAFPVRRVYCVGRNYAEHAVEMGHNPDREPPFFFQKNPEDLRSDGVFPYPAHSDDVHHEIELMVALKSGGRNIEPARALSHVWGYGLALDMTCRDIQAEAKREGRPWIGAKAFYGSAPCSSLSPAEDIGHPETGRIELRVNGVSRQVGDLAQQIWKVPEVVATLSRQFEIAAGDVLLTGTPSGVGPVEIGDRLDAEIEGVGALTVQVSESGFRTD